MRGRKHSAEAKLKISEAMKGSKGSSVELINVTTNEELLFSSIRQAEAYLKTGTGTLNYCLNNNKLYKKLWKIIKI